MSGAGGAAATAVSLVVASVGRSDPVERLLASLQPAEGVPLQVIVVDQNPDDRLGPVLAAHEGRLDLERIRAEKRGASAARNLGARQATHPVIGFPDDDCWYAPGLLPAVAEWFAAPANAAYAGLCGMARDGAGAPSMGRWLPAAADVARDNVWLASVEFAAFFRRDRFDALGGFDEGLGPGAPTGFACDEIVDLLLRGLDRGLRFRFDPAFVVHHDDPVAAYDERAVERARSYGLGTGRVLKRHGFPRRAIATAVGRSLGGAGLALATGRRGKARYHWALARARLDGWRRT